MALVPQGPGVQSRDDVRRRQEPGRPSRTESSRPSRNAAPDAFDEGIEITDRRDLLLAILRGAGDRSGSSEFLNDPRFRSRIAPCLVNGRDQPRVGAEILREIQSSQSVDLLSRVHQVARLPAGPRAVQSNSIARGGRLRVITTTYMGATDRKALDALVDIGAEVRVVLTKHGRQGCTRRPGCSLARGLALRMSVLQTSQRPR